MIDPATGEPVENGSTCEVNGIPRFCSEDNYTDSFGLQWNRFARTQIDGEFQHCSSEERFFAVTGWAPAELEGLDILEVGSGAGRFSRVVLERTEANLYSVDYSSAVEANWENNADIAPERFHLSQASVYELPYPDDSFDKVFCLGVLQHTPNFEESVRALIQKARPGGEVVVDFYPIKGWWTKLHAKYLFRPATKRMSHDALLRLIDRNADLLIGAYRLLDRMSLRPLTRFLPVCDLKGTLPPGLTEEQLREWVVLDTFDMFSPEYDNPQRLEAVVAMFERGGAKVTFAGFRKTGPAMSAVVKGIKT